jgi:hypothetical protein
VPDRDRLVPKHPTPPAVPVAVFDEVTGVHDSAAQAFRAVKALRSELRADLAASKSEAARAHASLRTELKAEIGGVKAQVSGVQHTLAAHGEGIAEINGSLKVMLADRQPSGTVARWSFATRVIVAIIGALGATVAAYLAVAHG